MTDLYGARIVIKERVVPIEPFPEWAQEFFESYALLLKEIYGKQEDTDMREQVNHPEQGQ